MEGQTKSIELDVIHTLLQNTFKDRFFKTIERVTHNELVLPTNNFSKTSTIGYLNKSTHRTTKTRRSNTHSTHGGGKLLDRKTKLFLSKSVYINHIINGPASESKIKILNTRAKKAANVECEREREHCVGAGHSYQNQKHSLQNK